MTLGLDRKVVMKVLESIGVVVACESPLEICQTQSESFASNSFAEIVVRDLVLNACNDVLNYKVNLWHKTGATEKRIDSFLGFSEAEYFRWVENGNHISSPHVSRLANEYIKNPELYKNS
jgi:hypothetical protein